MHNFHLLISNKLQINLKISEKNIKSEIWKLAYDLEKINHGTPSGIDNTTALYGGYIKFKNKKNFEIIDINKQFIHQIPLLVINTNIIGNTKQLVGNVKLLHNKYEMIMDLIFRSIEQIGENVINNLLDQSILESILAKNINELFSLNHGLLISIGVGHNIINKVQNICKDNGFDHGFKITGAGGGGCVIIPLLSKYNNDVDKNVMDKVVEKFRDLLSMKGYTSYLVETGQSGLSCKFH